jgi:hypothetical protein
VSRLPPSLAPVPRDGQCDDRRRRAARHQQAHALARKADQVLEPVERLVLDVGRRVVATGDARIERRGERLDQRGEHDRRSVDPAGEAWVPVAERIWHHVLGDPIEDQLGALAGDRETLGDQLAGHRVGERPEDRLLRQTGKVIGDEIDDAMPEPPDLVRRRLPAGLVLRVEGEPAHPASGRTAGSRRWNARPPPLTSIAR